MKTILFIALLFLTISIHGQKFSSGMSKMTTVPNNAEILIKAAGDNPPQFTTPVELFAGRAVSSVTGGYGLIGGTITTTGAFKVDTTLLLTKLMAGSLYQAKGTYVTGTPWTSMGYLTGITSGNVTAALGYTPYNSTNPSGFITSYTESDPTIYSWAKSATKPTYTYSEVGAAPSSTVSNATHTGDVTGSTSLTLTTVNSNIGTYNNVTINAKGLATAGSNISYLTADTKWDGGNTALNATTGRTSLGLGSIATKDSTSYVAKRDSIPLSHFISGSNGQVVKMRGDSSVVGITAGSDGQVLTMVSGSPAFASPSSGGSIFALTTSTNNYTGQALQNIPGLSITLAANSTYEFEVCLICGVSADATGAAFTVNYNGGAGADMSGIMEGSVSGTTYKSTTFSALGTAVSGYLTTASLFGGLRMKGIIATGTTSQPFTVQDLKTTSGTISVYKKSYLKVTLIP